MSRTAEAAVTILGVAVRHRTFMFITLAVIAADQLSKLIIVWRLPRFTAIPILDGFFRIVHLRNPGAAFGILAKFNPAWNTILFSLVFVVAAVVLVRLYLRAGGQPLLGSSLALMLGGACGNMIDRFLHGEVIDFLDFAVAGYHWPAFNLGDSSLVVGVGIYLAMHLFGGADRSRRNDASPRSPKRHGSVSERES